MLKSRFFRHIIGISLVFLAVYFYVIYTGKGFVVDEETHAWTISRFFNGEYVILDHLTVIPGYHFLVSIFERVFNRDNLEIKRLLSTIVGIISTLIFYLLHLRIHPEKTAIHKTWQFAFLPVIFPFFFLVYTDPLSLLFILLGLLSFSGKRYMLMGIFGILSLTVRQSNVI